MSLEADIQAILEADGDLMELLTGGVQDAVEISRELTPGAFDTNQELLPCALVKSGTEIARENKIRAVQTSLNIFLYQRSGYAAIEAALPIIHYLLAERHLNGIWQIQFNSEIARTTDETLNCPLAVQRYNVIRQRNYNSIGS
jgi:hypothetical protein